MHASAELSDIHPHPHSANRRHWYAPAERHKEGKCVILYDAKGTGRTLLLLLWSQW
jgi:hypothetical protein